MVDLIDDLKYFRAERPSEWKMDEFISKATAQKEEIERLTALVERYVATLDYMKDASTLGECKAMAFQALEGE